MLQTPHYFYSPDPFERNLDQFHKVPNEGWLFYGFVQDGTISGTPHSSVDHALCFVGWRSRKLAVSRRTP
jgi:hypothetical protein